MMGLPVIVLCLLRHFLVELHKFCNAVRFGESLDWEAVGRHDGTVVILVGGS